MGVVGFSSGMDYFYNKGTFYNWRKKYQGMDVSQLKRLKELEEENLKLKRMYANVSLDLQMAKDVLSKKW